MSIVYDASSQTFNLSTSKTSYIIKILDSKHIAHIYWGKKIKAKNLDYVLRSRNWGSFLTNTDNVDNFMLEAIPQEYPGYGSTDLGRHQLNYNLQMVQLPLTLDIIHTIYI